MSHCAVISSIPSGVAVVKFLEAIGKRSGEKGGVISTFCTNGAGSCFNGCVPMGREIVYLLKKKKILT